MKLGAAVDCPHGGWVSLRNSGKSAQHAGL